MRLFNFSFPPLFAIPFLLLFFYFDLSFCANSGSFNGKLSSRNLSSEDQKEEKEEGFSAMVEIEHNSTEILNYEIMRFVGKGVFGGVFKAVRRGEHGKEEDVEPVAIKHVIYNEDADYDYTFLEVELLNRLIQVNAKNVVRLKGAWEDVSNDDFFFLFDYYPGGTISNLFYDKRVAQLAAAEKQKLLSIVLKDVLIGLEDIHQLAFIIHGDLKPDNILIRQSIDQVLSQLSAGTLQNGLCVICDFGNSYQLPNPNAKSRGITCTWWYMGPEMAKDLSYGIGQDIWSVGIIALQLASGSKESPIGNNVAVLKTENPKIYFKLSSLPAPLNDFVSWALTANESCRPSAGELLTHAFITGDDFNFQDETKFCEQDAPVKCSNQMVSGNQIMDCAVSDFDVVIEILNFGNGKGEEWEMDCDWSTSGTVFI